MDAEDDISALRGCLFHQEALLQELKRSLQLETSERRAAQGHRMGAACRLAENVARELEEILPGLAANEARTAEPPGEAGPSREDRERIQESGRRIADLARRLRDIGGTRAARVELVDLNRIVERFVSLVRRAMPADVELDFAPAHDLAAIAADPALVEELLLHLCVNAREAMPNGGRVSIGTSNALLDDTLRDSHPWVSPGRYVLLSISDEGVGMTPDVQEHAFEPFFTTKAGKGVGTGLSKVHAIVRAHRGGVQFESEVGRGSEFEVYFPAMTRRAAVAEAPLADVVPPGTETILVAEDQEEVRRLLVRVLERAGFRVLAAADGWEATRLYSENIEEVRLVLLDVAMPNLGGRAAAERIRLLDPRAKILFASGSAERAVGVSNPLTPLLEKPYEPERLLRAIRRMLDGQEPF